MGTLVAPWVDASYSVAATALLDEQLFVSYEGINRVSVYNNTSFQLLRNINFSGLGTLLYGLVTSAINNYLYILDCSSTPCVHRVDLSVTSAISVITWRLPSPSYLLSLTSTGNVLVAFNNNSINWIYEYTPDGSVVRQVNTGTDPARQAIGLSNDVWAFTSLSPGNKLCTVLTMNSTVIKCFGSQSGSGITQLNNPVGLALDNHGYFLVADRDNNRTLMVDPSLTEAHQLQLQVNLNIQLPRSISLDQSRGRLYVGEKGGQYRVMVFDGIW